jgi:TP901 family phage tail tape measure protein
MADRELGISVKATATGAGDIRQMERTIDSLVDQVAKASKEFERQQKSSINLKAEWKRLAKEGSATRQELEQLSQQIQKSEKAEQQAINKTRGLIGEFKDLGGENRELKQRFTELNQRMDEAEGHITGVGGAAKLRSKDMNTLAKSVNHVGDEVKGLSGHLRDGLDKLKQLGPSGVAVGNLIADGLQDAARAAVDFVKESREAFLEYDRSTREIFTLIPQASAEQREALLNDAKLIGAELGRLPEEVLPSIYQALSSGVPEDNVISSVEVAAKAARAGVAELDDTMKVGLAIVNAYGLEVSELEGVYDQLFFLVKNGVITMNDLNNGFSEVTSVAGESRVPLSDITAALAVMTKQGDSAQEAFELLSTMLTQIATDGTVMATAFQEAAGVGFRDFIAQGGTLAEALQLLQQHAERSGQALGSMLSGGSPFYRDTQAARAALELTGVNMQNLIDLTIDAQTTTGEMAGAYAEFGGAAEENTLRASAAWEQFKITVGERANKLFDPLIANATEFLNIWNDIRTIEVGGMTEDLVQNAMKTGDWTEATSKLSEAWRNAQSILVDEDIRENMTASAEAIVAGIAASSVSIEDFRGKLEAANLLISDYQGEIAGYAFEIGDVLKEHANPAILEYTNKLWEAGTPTEELIRLGREYAFTLGGVSRAQEEASYKLERFARGSQHELEKLEQTAANTFEVLKILDGDTITIEIAGELKDIRLAGVDTPETAKEWLGKLGMPFAEEALEFTQEFLVDAQVQVDQTTTRETFDRMIADVRNLSGESLQEALAREGLALPLSVELTEDEEMTRQLEELARKAAHDGRGIFENQTIALEFLEGNVASMDDVIYIYEELERENQELTASWLAAAGPIEQATTHIKDSYGNMTGEVVIDSESIKESLRAIAYEAYLAENGFNASTIAMGVAMGVLNEEQANAQLEFVNSQTAVENLIARQDELGLSDQQLITATGLLIDGLAGTPEAAAKAAKGIKQLKEDSAGAEEKTRGLIGALEDLAGTYEIEVKTTYKEEGKPPSIPDGTSPAAPSVPEPTIPSMATGGVVPFPYGRQGLIKAHGGEIVIPPEESRAILNASRTAGERPYRDFASLFNGMSTAASPVSAGAGGQQQMLPELSITVIVENDRDQELAQTVTGGVLKGAQRLGYNV